MAIEDEESKVAEQGVNKVAERSRSYFISDLHLHPSRPHLFKLFYDFIDDITEQAEALYILGDLFEFWIGDDIIDLPFGKPYLPVLDKLKLLSNSGVKLYFLQGNRDFLAQEKLVNYIGAELLPDQKVIDLYGKKALIMHGDTLCIDDKAYQRMRFILRLKIVQKLYLSLCPESRNKKANKIRKTSQNINQQKEAMILDVNQGEVERVLSHATRGNSFIDEDGKTVKSGGGVSLLIHGHTHRPAIHHFELDGKPIKRIVLGDWRDKACYLKFSDSNVELVY